MSIDKIDISTLFTIAGTIFTSIGGLYMTIRKIVISREKAAKSRDASIMQQAKDQDMLLKNEINQKIRELIVKIEDDREDLQTEIEHLKETYNSELRFLGQKIEGLRAEVQNQHVQLMQILTKMINKD